MLTRGFAAVTAVFSGSAVARIPSRLNCARCQATGIALLLAAVGIICQPATATAAGQASQVTIAGFAFRPAQIVIHAGQAVAWTNRDSVAHTVTGQKGDWDSGNLATGASFSHVFRQPGTYEYTCAIHPNMTGVVIVR
jgi:plastocyanin